MRTVVRMGMIRLRVRVRVRVVMIPVETRRNRSIAFGSARHDLLGRIVNRRGKEKRRKTISSARWNATPGPPEAKYQYGNYSNNHQAKDYKECNGKNDEGYAHKGFLSG